VEVFSESRDAVADHGRVGAGAHRCRAGQAEQWTDLTEVVARPGLADADFVQENAPERPDAIIASSSSGITMSVMQWWCGCRR
jgi:hypothetical protein